MRSSKNAESQSKTDFNSRVERGSDLFLEVYDQYKGLLPDVVKLLVGIIKDKTSKRKLTSD